MQQRDMFQEAIDNQHQVPRQSQQWPGIRISMPDKLWQLALQHGRDRQAARQRNGDQTRKKDTRKNDLQLHLEGAVSELAFAVWLDSWGTFGAHRWVQWVLDKPLVTDRGVPDVWLVEVRSCAVGRGLLSQPSDLPTTPICFAWLNLDTRLTHLRGWAFAHEVKKDCYDFRGSCHIMPADDTHGLTSLQNWFQSMWQGHGQAWLRHQAQ